MSPGRSTNISPWLSYDVVCDGAWRTCSARVRRWIGDRFVELSADRADDGAWKLNGKRAPQEIGRCCDLDLGFTPATNVIPVRRLALTVGQEAEATAARLDPSDWTLENLLQRYRRESEQEYWYEAPAFGYAATLSVTQSGMLRRYPGLWELENNSE